MTRLALSYTPYGHRAPAANQGPVLGFNGEWREPPTDAYPLGQGYRRYSTATMRFGAPDSQSPFDPDCMNAYAYCVGDPVNQSDPTGHAPTAEALLAQIKSMQQRRARTQAAPATTNYYATRSKAQTPQKSVAFAQQTIVFTFDRQAAPLSLFDGGATGVMQWKRRKALTKQMNTAFTSHQALLADYMREMHLSRVSAPASYTGFARNPYHHERMQGITQELVANRRQLLDLHATLRGMRKA